MNELRRAVHLALLFFVGLPVCAQEPMPEKMAHPDHLMLAPADFTWKEGPASLPKGASFAMLEGDPAKAGPFTLRLKLPADYKVPPHSHPAIEHVTVLTGSFIWGWERISTNQKPQSCLQEGWQ